MFDNAKLSEVLYQLLIVVLIPLAGFAARWLAKKWEVERANLNDKNKWLLDEVVKVAVYAAEQVYSDGKGAEKKAYALSVAETWLAQYHINIDLHALEAAIEAEVKQSFGHALPEQKPLLSR